MDAIRDAYLAVSASRERISARQIVRQHECFVESTARPAYRKLFWGPTWFVGEAPKRSHVAACQSFSRLAHIWHRLQLKTPVEFLDLTDRPMPKSHNRWGDKRPALIDAAVGARKLLREALGLSGALTSDLFVVLLGSTAREAFGARRLDLYRWHRLPRSEMARGELFLAAIPHPSPLASRIFNERGVEYLLKQLHFARPRRPTLARDHRRIDPHFLRPLEI